MLFGVMEVYEFWWRERWLKFSFIWVLSLVLLFVYRFWVFNCFGFFKL